MANYKLTITPHAGDLEGFKYVVTLSRPDETLPVEHEANYGQLEEIESALQQMGGSALVDIAGKTLELGHPFTHIIELTNSQRSILVKTKLIIK